MASHDNPFTTPEPTHTPVDAASRGAYSTPGSGSGQNLASGNGGWQEKYPSSSSGRRKWIILGSVVGLAAVIAIAVGVGVGVSHHHNSSSGNRASTSSPNTSTNPTAVNQTDPNDPSTFVKDSRLKQSFYALAYTPSGAIPPNCTSTLGMSSSVTTFFSFLSLTAACAIQPMLFKIFKCASTHSLSETAC
jgi:hypothetical protein